MDLEIFTIEGPCPQAHIRRGHVLEVAIEVNDAMLCFKFQLNYMNKREHIPYGILK